jgi:hypothetical protein
VSFPISRLSFRRRRRGKLRNVDQAEHTLDLADLPLKKTTSVTGNGLATRFGGTEKS